MFYSMYLSGLCERRRWPEPMYEPSKTRQGHFCKVRVNNREYGTDVPYNTEALAEENAAMKAFMICRNFSANDGMFPGQRPGQTGATGMVQGLPVAIGSGRRGNRNSNSSVESQYSEASNSSGGNSPNSYDSGFNQSRQMVPTMPRPARKSRMSNNNDGYICLCGRGPVSQYGQCMTCLTQRNWIMR